MLSLISGVRVVAIAQDGREAVELARQHEPDIAIMDIKMPGMNGLAAIRSILQERPEMVCIVISGERERPMLREAMAAGAREYLIKPFTSDQLIIAIRRISQIVTANRLQYEEAGRLRHERDAYLLELATEYARNRRTDTKAMAIYEELAANPRCDPRWLNALALIYVVHKEWGKLKGLAERLEKLER
ncbi:MAG: response regulator [Chloroflexi bacterium]|nr:response regulator [Chloroflexota bacterium]MCI0577439.1 response regulator [Chloroflexota bacterium]MCI0649707.1 response regulator [Chloroflexota bacterium]MCI0725437.1 response regulator [Chloroflexota bacterium]